MACVEALLVILLAVRPFYADASETREQRAALITPTVQAICGYSPKLWTRAVLAATALDETHFARCVLEDRCHQCPFGMRCDEGLATGPWQVRRHCVAAWDQKATREARERAGAKCTMRTYRASVLLCPDVAWGGFIAHRGWRGCDAPWAAQRYRLARWLAAQLAKRLEGGAQ